MVSEKKIFENGGRRRTPDHGHPISSPCEPNGSGELKIRIDNSEGFLDVFQSTRCLNQRTNGPVNAHLRPEIYTCTNRLVRLEWYNACI